MPYTSFDPRDSIIDKIGVNYDVYENGSLESCVTVKDSKNNKIYIPMFHSEDVKSGSLPEFPFIEMRIVNVTYEPHDIGAATRKKEAHIDFHIYYADTDDLTRKDFGEKIKDRLQHLIRTNQCDFTNITFINYESDKYFEEANGRQVIYHYVMTIYCLYYDLC